MKSVVNLLFLGEAERVGRLSTRITPKKLVRVHECCSMRISKAYYQMKLTWEDVGTAWPSSKSLCWVLADLCIGSKLFVIAVAEISVYGYNSKTKAQLSTRQTLMQTPRDKRKPLKFIYFVIFSTFYLLFVPSTQIVNSQY